MSDVEGNLSEQEAQVTGKIKGPPWPVTFGTQKKEHDILCHRDVHLRHRGPGKTLQGRAT